MLNDLKNKKIAILGLGIEGITTIEYLLGKGITDITVLDKKTKEELQKENPEVFTKLEKANIQFSLGENYLHNVSDFNLIMRAPGISVLTKELVAAQEKGIVISSNTKLFIDLCPCIIIGVTGSKGKGTNTTLIYEMLKKEEKDGYIGGNIGKPPLTFLDKLTDQLICPKMSKVAFQYCHLYKHLFLLFLTFHKLML